MADQCKTCPSQAGCNSSPEKCGESPDKSLLGAFNDIRNVIAVMSGKGGVGKSSVTGLIASSLAKKGKKVGVLDADITGPSQPKALGIDNREGLKASQFGIIPPQSRSGIKVMSINFFLPHEDDPVIWRGPLLAGAVNQFWGEVDWQDLDYMVVDLPPGTGDVPLTVMQSLPVNGIVIVSSPQDLAFMVVKKTIKMAKKMNAPILGLLENMSYAVCPHCGEKINIFGESQGENIAKEMGIDYLGALPWDAKLNLLIDEGRIEEYVSPQIDAVVEKIIAKLP
ncbi:Chromosome partitioning ATPase, Mrp family, contains Fe-S cluster [Thermosyntropha lipolytica DSM 11003]|uniref:Iron-sulfur cluster carrier protein n=1 Tax=Thermosyntropha lipolytica DSM 11003 TaxID=1123382 RepID=A0A1M5L666_9FIRM|nr:Mrp/NBP35 family ATP-binding protein [Thermosyntropha lipolytica]SHG60582.1 Chromosome partitioning ATPase, Mrp family, contains Fe-S cluster [Thermosyntropha lipolytica DSM 11003]